MAGWLPGVQAESGFAAPGSFLADCVSFKVSPCPSRVGVLLAACCALPLSCQLRLRTAVVSFVENGKSVTAKCHLSGRCSSCCTGPPQMPKHARATHVPSTVWLTLRPVATQQRTVHCDACSAPPRGTPSHHNRAHTSHYRARSAGRPIATSRMPLPPTGHQQATTSFLLHTCVSRLPCCKAAGCG